MRFATAALATALAVVSALPAGRPGHKGHVVLVIEPYSGGAKDGGGGLQGALALQSGTFAINALWELGFSVQAFVMAWGDFGSAEAFFQFHHSSRLCVYEWAWIFAGTLRKESCVGRSTGCPRVPRPLCLLELPSVMLTISCPPPAQAPLPRYLQVPLRRTQRPAVARHRLNAEVTRGRRGRKRTVFIGCFYPTALPCRASER